MTQRLNAAALAILAQNGIAFQPGLTPAYIPAQWMNPDNGFSLAMDAQPTLITTSNAGIPAFLANLIDSEIVRILTQPMMAAEIFGEVKKGDWTLLTTQFPVVEPTGEVSSYGDYNNNGSSGANVNWVPRQSYHFQTLSRWGERELAMYGEAKIQYKSEIDLASALVLQKFFNLMYFYGVANLQNFGGLNDPSLPAPIAPTAAWSTLDAADIYEDIRRLFGQLQTQMTGLVNLKSEMTLAMSPFLEVYLAKTDQYNVNVSDMLKKNFPGLTVKTAPEYGNANSAGQLMQLIVTKIDGLQTTYSAFTEKLRAHPVIQDVSSFKQKKSAGGWGTIIRRPVAIAQMQGM